MPLKDTVPINMEAVVSELKRLDKSHTTLEVKVNEHEAAIENLSKDIQAHNVAIENLDKDIKEIKVLLGNVATKNDINVVLRDALNAVPGQQVALWTMITAVIMGVALF